MPIIIMSRQILLLQYYFCLIVERNFGKINIHLSLCFAIWKESKSYVICMYAKLTLECFQILTVLKTPLEITNNCTDSIIESEKSINLIQTAALFSQITLQAIECLSLMNVMMFNR